MDWQPLESKLLASSAYDSGKHILYLRFRSGEVYRYFEFLEEPYREFLEAESHGRYFLNLFGIDSPTIEWLSFRLPDQLEWCWPDAYGELCHRNHRNHRNHHPNETVWVQHSLPKVTA